jgi:ankyrin repeat protein
LTCLIRNLLTHEDVHWNQSFSHANILDKRTYHTLTIAAYRGYTEIVNMVLGRQENKIYAKSHTEEKIGMEALYNAIRSGNTGIAKILLDREVDVDCKAKSAGKSNSMLNVSIDDADEDMARLLLSYRADPNVRVLALYNQPERESILAQAYRRGKRVIMKLLLEAGARTFEHPV